ncbi:MAG: hypothetical protein L6Q92_01260 [Phycisphaerae bacterium]|nr:hypothetical protein [Phycisphaerae bacterium]
MTHAAARHRIFTRLLALIALLAFGSFAPPAMAVVDVALGEFFDLAIPTGGRVAPNNGTTTTTVSCNVGTERVDWRAQMNPNHPFITFELYRLESGRLVQIGISWTKHGFFALDQSLCSTCTDPNGGSGVFLGVNCSDTYSTANNANRNYLGPRTEIDPWNATWQPCGSYFDNAWGTIDNDCLQSGTAPTFNGTSHRMIVHDDDINPALHAGAIYYTEGVYIIKNDANRGNNIGWRRIGIGGSPGAYTFTNQNPDGTTMSNNHAGRVPQYGPALNVWGSHRVTLNANAAVFNDGEVYVATQATDLGGGTWHYEYAVYNYNYTAAVREFSIPMPPCGVVSNVGFRDWKYSQPVTPGDAASANDVDGTDWTYFPGAGMIGWRDDSGTNPIRWGQLFNFWFDCNLAPAASTVTVTSATVTSPPTLSGALQGPNPAYVLGDVNGDTFVNTGDIPDFVNVLLFGTVDPCVLGAANVDGVGGVDGLDVQEMADLLY